jgi:hypothetical protein
MGGCEFTPKALNEEVFPDIAHFVRLITYLQPDILFIQNISQISVSWHTMKSCCKSKLR